MREHIEQAALSDTTPTGQAMREADEVWVRGGVHGIARLIDHINTLRSDYDGLKFNIASENTTLRADLAAAECLIAESVSGAQQMAEEMAALREENKRLNNRIESDAKEIQIRGEILDRINVLLGTPLGMWHDMPDTIQRKRDAAAANVSRWMEAAEVERGRVVELEQKVESLAAENARLAEALETAPEFVYRGSKVLMNFDGENRGYEVRRDGVIHPWSYPTASAARAAIDAQQKGSE